MGLCHLTVPLVLALALFSSKAYCQDVDGIYKVGTGIGDVTGPAAGVVLNGYVNPLTLAAGIHTRLHARSFIVESIDTGKSVVFVTCDLGMLDHAIKIEAVKKLRAEFGEKYTEHNIMISATHTHSGPSGYMQNFAYIVIESYGFNPLSFWAIVDGVVDSIRQADAKLTRGRVFRNKGQLLGYNGNRRTDQYLMNPEEERNMYPDTVDKDMILLKLESIDDQGNPVEPLGAFTWWPVHPITFNGWDNPLVSSDSRGYAAVRFDYEMNKGAGARPGRGKFVAGFASANLGDVSPRKGGGKFVIEEAMEDVRIVGTGQFQKAFELFNDEANLKLVKGPIDFVHQYVNMPEIIVDIRNAQSGITEEKKLCKASLGYSFVGIEPGAEQFWDFLLDLLQATPSEEMKECHLPKLVAVPAGEMHEPWEWAPSIVDLQVLRIGDVDIVSMPGELTTMAGRRLRRSIQALRPEGHEVILAGLANNYINYVATPEEYDFQEYEGGATIFGRHTLDGIIQTQVKLVNALNRGETVPPGSPPPTFTDILPKKIPDLVDTLPNGRQWGQELSRPQNLLYTGQDMLMVFKTPAPRHDPLRTKSHFLIQRLNEDSGEWEDVRTDADLDTTFWWNAWKRQGEVTWYEIPHDTVPGTYRVYHTGFYLEKSGEDIKQFEGTSEPFMLQLHPSIPTDPPPSAAKINSAYGLVLLVGFLFSIASQLNQLMQF